MTKRRSIGRTERVRIFDAAQGVCHICGTKIDGTREKWDVEHVIPLQLGGEDTGENLQPAHVKCHAAKTKDDMSRISKAKRVSAKHIGAVTAKNPIPGGRASKWKRTINGRVVPRE